MNDSQGAARPAAHEPMTHASETDRIAVIRQLNDRFRRSLHGGRVFVTAGVQALGPAQVNAILSKIQEFDDFTEENDPYGEHDFGAIKDGDRFFWKIDYYDKALQMGSPNPADPDQTCRVLTIMLTSEY